jgi:glutamate--cysteine ligase
VGLLYDDAALTATEALLQGVTWQDAVTLRSVVPKQGLDAELGQRSLRLLAKDVVAIARDGLRARGRRDPGGDDEQCYVDPLLAIADGAPTQAEEWLARWRGDWHGDVRQIFAEAAI